MSQRASSKLPACVVCLQEEKQHQTGASALVLHSDSDFLDIVAQPLTFTNAAFADRLYQGACDACNIYILLSGHRNIALLAEVSADYFCSAQSQAMDPVAEAAICTSLLPQKARA